LPEYWFKYGSTEISVEVPNEVEHEKVKVSAEARRAQLEEEVRRLAERVVEEAGGEGIAVLYDHVGEGAALDVLGTLIAELDALEASERLNLLVSGWRLDPRVASSEAEGAVKRLGKPLRVEGLERVEVAGGLWAVRPLAEARVRVLVSAAEPHGLLGVGALREALTLGGAVGLAGADEGVGRVEEIWERVLEELPSLGLCAVGGRVMAGEAGEVDDSAREEVERVFAAEVSRKAEIALVGAGGWPRDASLESSAHVLKLAAEGVGEDGLIGLVAECSKGLGSPRFEEALVKGGGKGLQAALAELLREVSEERRVALTSTLPKALAEKLLGMRSFDTLQELLVYGFRLYSKKARVLIAENGVLLLRAREGRS